MNNLLSEIDGWTPVIDALVEEVGLITAAVYGVVWRYCQMSDHTCHASLDTIASKLQVDKATAQRHIKVLCEAGYLEDKTPDLRNRPHTYVDTGRAKITMLITARCTAQRSVAHNNAVLHTTTQCCTKSLEETNKKQSNKQEETPVADATVANATPSSFQGWLTLIKASKNYVSSLRRMFTALYPENSAPDYAYMGKVTKRVGGASRMAQLLWENSARPPVGDVLAYISASNKKKEIEPKGFAAVRAFMEEADG